MNDTILYDINSQGVATITLNRPDIHNAFDDALISQLIALLQQLNDQPQVKLVVLAAAGKSFSAGADLNWMRRMVGYSYEENTQDALALAELMQTLKCLAKPTIARVQGAAYGGGVGLVACCDIAIASLEASFCLSEVKIGLIPAVISPYVTAAIGERAMRYYSFTAVVMTALEAQRLGLVTQAVEAAELDVAVNQIINQLLKNSPQAISAAKTLINRIAVNPYDRKHNQQNAEAIAAIRVSPEGQEGLSAFLEKRKPSWYTS